jgi:type 1 fimbriae regulatory protein FimB/type 1 fimbriae regulatory protein FimE
MAKGHLKLVTPATVNRTVTPKRPLNSKLRTREYLTEVEVERLMNAARKNTATPRWCLWPTDMACGPPSL